MEGIYYDCSENSLGHITLYAMLPNHSWPQETDEENTRYLQSDEDTEQFRAEWDKIVKIWARKFGKGYRKHYGPFNSYNEMMDVLISQYF